MPKAGLLGEGWNPSLATLGGGWVCSRRQFTQDQFEHAVHFGKHLVVPESQHLEAGVLEESRTDLVHCDRLRVLAAIEFDDKFSIQAHEIDDVIAERVLASKFASFQLA